jgi:PPP family 3-phenylpropionic acid transporter
MFAFTWLVKKLTNHRLMQISVIAFSIKNVLTALAVNIPMLYGISLLQAFGYALFTPASVYFIAHAIDEKDLNKGQALMTASMMMSSVFATLVGGVLFDLFPVRIVLVVGAILSVLGTLIILNGLKAFDSKM